MFTLPSLSLLELLNFNWYSKKELIPDPPPPFKKSVAKEGLEI